MKTDITDSELFDKVRDHINEAHLVAWDECHKIYLALDEIEAGWFRDSGGYTIVTGTPDEMLAILGEWWDKSCALRFISGVHHNATDPNAGFVTLIGQFEDSEDEDEDDYDDDED